MSDTLEQNAKGKALQSQLLPFQHTINPIKQKSKFLSVSRRSYPIEVASYISH